MSDSVKEQLSACLDGELAEAELDLLLKRLDKDAELRDSLSRYALTSEALRGADRVPFASRDFTAKVMAAVAGEAPLARRRWQPSSATLRVLRPAAGLAVAAGVAAVAVMSVQSTDTVDPSATIADAGSPGSGTRAPADVANNVSYIVPTTNTTSAIVPAARLTNYVVAHSEYSSPLGRRTVLSGVLAEDDSEQSAEDLDAPPETVVTHP